VVGNELMQSRIYIYLSTRRARRGILSLCYSSPHPRLPNRSSAPSAFRWVAVLSLHLGVGRCV
jgi:hypothetical protein